MVFQWIIFVVVMLSATFLMIGPQLIGISSALGVYLCGMRAKIEGRARRRTGVFLANSFEAVVGVMIATLILLWVRQILDGESVYEAPAGWLVGGVFAILPSLQTLGLMGREREYDYQSYIVRIPVAPGLVAAPAALFAILILILAPSLLDYALYPLLILTGLITLATLIVVFLVHRGPKWRETTHRSQDNPREVDDGTQPS